VSTAVETVPVMAVRGVSKTFERGPERLAALRDVSLDVRPGEVVGLVGPSGSGKTTLLSVMAGWERPDEGSVEWRGDAVALRKVPWNEMAVVPQDLALLEELSNVENVTLAFRMARGQNAPASERIAMLADLLGITEFLDRMPHEVSLGEQQRVAMARALALSPRLVLADEPTAHQDEASTKQLLRAIRAAADSGTAFVIATHSSEVVQHLDRVVAMRDGRLTAGSPIGPDPSTA
jgi:putative ABC transport system ATP-binding protein